MAIIEGTHCIHIDESICPQRTYLADTLAELNALVDVKEGSTGYAKDTHRLYFWDGAAWRQIRF